ncbi:trafficking protein particle complex subunit 6b-like [Sycon ciliatum]|uniref:trafficking protein particle complex subunit 6b-like n=1 Tax=Sycon ciliatum TaxID=27933 RepID=UPI0020A8E322|eukprot:scpid88369/ scgid22414/ Trafficking protein particle complex subunit 6B &gt; Trafficking protein particle complex subunit 6B
MTTESSSVDDTLLEFLHMEAVKLLEEGSTGEGMNTATTKLDTMGFRVGIALVERCSADTMRFKDELDMMRFLCKDFWLATFMKQIDNLRTNHQGVYVLQDSQFRFLTNVAEGTQYLQTAQSLLAFSCGVVRGALFNLGLTCSVTVEVTNLPVCKFHVTVI